MSMYRKKPVVIEAIQYLRTNVDAVADFIAPQPLRMGATTPDGAELHILTLEDGAHGEAKHVASPGDWIIRGVAGEIYPCKPDIFAATYDAVTA